ncbi:competence damage-inducible protein A [Fictibacillus macauensis ZFHKF-1]|uniref:Putative competence-damage inducible protein n=1 Tax=Fictibacillus macauensis ZFHKF-1 TaxID=1196324 RepID=I8UE15_9BACL|nr:competence/damage-inducible protein A [Fictibacillus macauensis]EIT85150.1 competence damage-inducible protein A [Fictibacillus macauensis ZFHKF-1]
MNAEIIAVGSELLLGQIVNSNAQFISKELATLGVNVFYHTAVGDNSTRLTATIKTAQRRSNVIIFTGGLGPTKDDLTKETIASLLGRPLTYDEDAMEHIEDYFKRSKRQMSENNRKQALVLDGCHVLKNEFGMAPGMALQVEGITYILLPGPPKEMGPMFVNYAIPYLAALQPEAAPITSRVLRFFGIGESLLEATLQDIIDEQQNPTVAPLAGNHEVTLRLSAKFHDQKEALLALDQLEHRITERVGEFLYGYDETTLMKEAAQLFVQKGLTVAAAESLTGGGFGAEMTSLDGSSAYFLGSLVSYSNEMKEALLDIPSSLLKTEGAVSAACAELMAASARTKTGADIGISFTGVAGPQESEGKEVGTVFIGLSTNQKTTVHEVHISGSREAIRARTIKYGLFYLMDMVKKGQ